MGRFQKRRGKILEPIHLPVRKNDNGCSKRVLAEDEASSIQLIDRRGVKAVGGPQAVNHDQAEQLDHPMSLTSGNKAVI